MTRETAAVSLTLQSDRWPEKMKGGKPDRGRKPVAEMRPLPTGRRLGDLPEILRSLPHLRRGDATAFAEDVEDARNNLDAIA